MEAMQVRVEVERIVNLVAGFGWEKIEEKIEAGQITLTLKKKIPVSTSE